MDLTEFLKGIKLVSETTNNPSLIPKVKLNDSNFLWPVKEVKSETNRKGKLIRNLLVFDGIMGEIELPIPRANIYFDDVFLNYCMHNALHLPDIITEIQKGGNFFYYVEISLKEFQNPPHLNGALYRTPRGRLKPLISVDWENPIPIVNSKFKDPDPHIAYYFINFSKAVENG